MKLVFISGPHGCGKSTIIKKLLEKKDNYELDNFYLDFIKELQNISELMARYLQFVERIIIILSV